LIHSRSADSEYNSALLSTNIILTYDGNVTWLSSAIFKSSCAINVEYFPFDEQKCSMKFSSWTYDGLQVNLLNLADEGDLSNYVPNGEWDLIDLIVERHVVYYSCCEEPYPDITYHIILRRRPLFYGQFLYSNQMDTRLLTSWFYSLQPDPAVRTHHGHCSDELLHAVGFWREGDARHHDASFHDR